MLEYYEGVLFLATNRISNIDSAFHSRIHISLRYDTLTSTARRQIWQNFMKVANARRGDSGEVRWALKDEHLGELAGYELNGREIKNALKTALLVAEEAGEPMGLAHVETVLCTRALQG